MKLLLQNNPVYIKDCKPPQRLGGATYMPLRHECGFIKGLLVEVSVMSAIRTKFERDVNEQYEKLMSLPATQPQLRGLIDLAQERNETNKSK